jgi:hypothetical protein
MYLLFEMRLEFKIQDDIVEQCSVKALRMVRTIKTDNFKIKYRNQ